jgi:hypothetical protein
MKLLTSVLFSLLISVSTIVGQTNHDETRVIAAEQADPWTTQIGLQYAAVIYAQVFKDGVLFQPTGLLLGVFKNGLCYGSKGIIAGPKGPVHMITMGCNNASEDGFIYKAYDPTTSTIYTITETVNFRSLVSVGSIAAPIRVNISGVSALHQNNEALFSIFPNPVENEITISVGDNGSKQSSIELYNTSGQLIQNIYNGELTSNQKISVPKGNNLRSGIYLLKVRIGEKAYTKSLIIK